MISVHIWNAVAGGVIGACGGLAIAFLLNFIFRFSIDFTFTDMLSRLLMVAGGIAGAVLGWYFNISQTM